MKTLAAIILCVLLGAAPISAQPPAIGDMTAAMELCDAMPLSGPEGIWRFDADKVSVLILKDADKTGRWNITVVESDDVALRAGDVIGWLEESTDTKKFKLNLFTGRKRGKLCTPLCCMAVYSEKDESLRIERSKLKLTINPLGFLPYFWRSIRVKVDDPGRELPKGMIRIYPGYDGNGSSRREPLYL